MKLIIALGNPERKYDDTRHNVGFALLDAYATAHQASFAAQSKFHADIAEFRADDERVLLVKPTTYYNEVGLSARSLIDFYKLSTSDVLVIHDDLNLPLGTIRTRIGGSDGGNNGLKSLASHIGLTTARLRVGTWHETHQGSDMTAVVLGKFNASERKLIANLQPIIDDVINDFIRGNFEGTTHRAGE